MGNNAVHVYVSVSVHPNFFIRTYTSTQLQKISYLAVQPKAFGLCDALLQALREPRRHMLVPCHRFMLHGAPQWPVHPLSNATFEDSTLSAICTTRVAATKREIA